MPAKRNASQVAPAETKVQGAAWEATDPALTILVERLNQLSMTMELMAKNTLAAQQQQNATIQQVLLELAEEKARSAEALTAAKEALQKIHEATPLDPVAIKAMEDALFQEAKGRMEKKRAHFKEELATMETGVLTNHGEETLVLGVNGCYVRIPPGESREVPVVFVQEFESQLEARRRADRYEHAIRGGNLPYGDMEVLRQAITSPGADKQYNTWQGE